MKSKKVFIGGRVDSKLKSRFIKELRALNRRAMAQSGENLTQSKFLEILLLESVALRKKQAKKS